MEEQTPTANVGTVWFDPHKLPERAFHMFDELMEIIGDSTEDLIKDLMKLHPKSYQVTVEDFDTQTVHSDSKLYHISDGRNLRKCHVMQIVSYDPDCVLYVSYHPATKLGVGTFNLPTWCMGFVTMHLKHRTDIFDQQGMRQLPVLNYYHLSSTFPYVPPVCNFRLNGVTFSLMHQLVKVHIIPDPVVITGRYTPEWIETNRIIVTIIGEVRELVKDPSYKNMGGNDLIYTTIPEYVQIEIVKTDLDALKEILKRVMGGQICQLRFERVRDQIPQTEEVKRQQAEADLLEQVAKFESSMKDLIEDGVFTIEK